MLFAVSWGVGYVLLCNNIIVKYTKKNPKVLIRIPHGHVFVVGAIAAVIIEVFGNWLWKLWYYPHFSIPFYLMAMLFIQIVYFYFILKGYLAVRAMLVASGFSKKKIRLNKQVYKPIFNMFGIIGGIFLAIGLIQAIGMLHPPLDASFLNSFGVRQFNVANVFLITSALVLILEFLEYREKEDTFILHILQGDWTPLITVLIASMFTAASMEGFNVPLSLWIYTNWPYPHIAISGLPLTILIGWATQYVLLVSVYRFLYKRETAKIWY